jgi:hypothetical protein
MRRYELLAIFNLSPADDDGNAGSGRDDFDQRHPQDRKPTQTTGKAPAKAATQKATKAPENAQAPAQTSAPEQNKAFVPPTDAEQEKAGRISNSQVEMISKIYKQKNIPKENLQDWLGLQFALPIGNRTPWGIPKDKFKMVCNVILKTPEEIIGPKNETPPSA